MGPVCSLATLAVLLASAALADEPVEISLDSVWALDMPGTRNILMLDEKRSLIEPLLATLKSDGRPPLGTAMRGVGLGALQEFYRLRVKNQKRPGFDDGDEVSLVFFTYPTGAYVHVHEVGRSGNAFTIKYRFAPHDHRGKTRHFALIPVGKLTAGKYVVSISQSPMEKKHGSVFRPVTPEYATTVASNSFEFLVHDRK